MIAKREQAKNSNGETKQTKLLKEIGDIAHIPDLQDFFSKALKKAKQIFHDKIKNLPDQQEKNIDNSQMDIKEPARPKNMEKVKENEK